MTTALFDLDGTLVDSRPGIVASLRAMLRGLGHPIDKRADYTWAVGPPLEQSIGAILAPYGDTRMAEGARLYREHYSVQGLFVTTLFPGIETMLDALAGQRLFVVTSKREVFARKILDRLGLAQCFVAIHGTIEGGAFDDKAALLRHVLDRHGIDRTRAVMIGDRHHDIDAARANAVASIGVAWGYAGAGELAAADAMVARPDELPAAIAAWTAADR